MIEDAVQRLAQGKNFCALTTLFPSGHPQTHVMWVDADDDHVMVNTEIDRKKYENVQHDPRVTVTIWDATNPQRYAEVRGEVVEMVTGPEARAHIDKLAQKYRGADYPDGNIRSERVVLKISPRRQLLRG